MANGFSVLSPSAGVLQSGGELDRYASAKPVLARKSAGATEVSDLNLGAVNWTALPSGASGLVEQSDVDALRIGIAEALGKIESLLALEAFAEELPIFGDQLKAGFDALGNALDTGQSALTSITGIKNAIITALNAVTIEAEDTAAEIKAELEGAINSQIAGLANGYQGLVTVVVNETTGDLSLVFDTGRASSQSFALGDLGMQGLSLDLTGSGQASFGFDFNFKVGVDGTGFYLDANDTFLSLGADVDLATLAATGELGFLRYAVSNIDDESGAGVADTLNLDFLATISGGDFLRGFTTDILEVRASGDLDLDLHLAADMGAGTLNAAVVPNASADLRVDWSFVAALLNGATTTSPFAAPTVTFENVQYDIGSFVEDVITPILAQLDPILGPINEALAVLRTPLSFLPDNWTELLDVAGAPDGGEDGEVTALDFLKLAVPSLDMGPIALFLDIAEKVVDWVEFFRGREFADEAYDLGSYSFISDLQAAADTLLQLQVNAGDFDSSGVDLDSFIAGLSSDGFDDSFGGQTGGELVAGIVSDDLFDFSILENPLDAIRLIFGQQVDLFGFDLPAINLSAGFDAEGNITNPINLFTLPILAVPPVTGEINVAFQALIDLAFGFDSRGLVQFAEGGFNPADFGDIFNGFYLDDQLTEDGDIAEIVIRAAIEIVIEANLGLFSVGGGGNILGEVFLDFANELFGEDGRLYIDELLFDLESSPFQLFDVSGRVTAGFNAYVNSFWGNVWRGETARITLVEFSFKEDAEIEGPPPGLGDEFAGGVVLINVGGRAGERDIANKTDGAERIEIAGSGDRISVSGFGEAQRFGASSQPITEIRANGGAEDDQIFLDDNVAAFALLTGGGGADILVGGSGGDSIEGGNNSDLLVGQDGTDTLRGDDGDDYLEGGADGDSIEGGEGVDIVSYSGAAAAIGLDLESGVHSGDAAGDSFGSIEAYEGSSRNDTINGSETSGDFFSGLAGNDTLRGRGGDDFLVGGVGADLLNGGGGADMASYFAAGSGVTVTLANGAGGGSAGEAAGDSFAGIEAIEGSGYADSMTGGAGAQAFEGGGGNDSLSGGEGDDVLAGGLDGDSLVGGDGLDEASYRRATGGVTLNLATGGTGGEAAGDSYAGVEGVAGSDFNDKITGDGLVNSLFGFAGADTLKGAGGNDTLLGGAGADELDGGQDFDVASYELSTAAITLDLVNGTRAGDAIGDSFFNIEVYAGTQNHADFIRGTNEVEEIRGLGGNDSIFGADGNDALLGGAGNDDISGEDADDLLHGGDGADRFFGGAGRDRVTYFDSPAGVAVNLSTVAQSFGATTIALLSANDGRGSTDSFGADTATGRSSVEDARGSAFADLMVASELGSELVGLPGADRMRGMQGSDTLNGGAGADSLDGGAGGSDYASYVDDGAAVSVNLGATLDHATDGGGARDQLSNIEGVIGSRFGDTLSGKAGVNQLSGGDGNDTLDGKTGDDVMTGGKGDDMFMVDRGDGAPGSGDQVIEEAGGGRDLIRATLNYSLAALPHVEDLQLLGTAREGTGNSDSNRIVGNGTANILDGRGGGDTFWGYAGNDVYYFDSFGDTVGLTAAPRSDISGAGELAGGGTDEIRLATLGLTPVNTRVTYTIDTNWAQQIENVILLDDDRAIDLTGNARSNLLVGNAHWQTLIGGLGADTLDPGVGRDTAHGGAGSDTLRVDWSLITYGQAHNISGNLEDGYDGAYFWGPSPADGAHLRVDFTDIEAFDITMGSGGDDIRTGDSHDRVLGGAGNDTLRTGMGADTVNGGSESDGARGVDVWVGDKSNASANLVIDLTLADGGNYKIGTRLGSYEGIEALGLNAATERFSTGRGSDRIRTLDARYNDYLFTNAKNDQVTLAGGRDYADLGAGKDTLTVDWSDLDYGQTTSFGGELATGYQGAYFWGPSPADGAHDRVDFFGVEHFRLFLGGGGDYLITGDGNDSIHGGAGNDHLVSRVGRDTIDGGAGDDRWEADKSAATAGQAIVIDLSVDGLQSTYFTSGTVSNIDMLTLITGAGADVVRTKDARHDDQVTTNLGTDRVIVAGGRDVVALGGQAANARDTLVVDWSDLEYGQTHGFSGSLATGYDGAYFWGPSPADGAHDRVDFTGVERFEISLGSGGDDIRTGDAGDSISGNAGNDVLRSGFGADTIIGGDEIDATRGIDCWVADKSDATVGLVINLSTAAASTYVVAGRAGSVRGIEVLGLNTGTEKFSSGSGGDLITTMDARYNDFIATNAGNDVVRIAGGRDWIDFGPGFDTLVLDWSDTDSGHTHDVSGNLTDGYAGAFYWGPSPNDGARDRVDFTGVERFDLTFGSGHDHIRVGDADDAMRGNGGNDVLRTGKGADTVVGGNEADGSRGIDSWTADKSDATVGMRINLTVNTASAYTIDGRTGSVAGVEALGLSDEWFLAGSGDDTITTMNARYNDYVVTAAGNDRVSLSGGRDNVAFGFGDDTLVIDWSDIDYGQTTSLAGDLAAGYDGAFFWGPSPADGAHDRADFTDAEHFSLTTGSGNDYLATGNGRDTVKSGAGDDHISSRQGVDVIDGGAGADRWEADKSFATAQQPISINLTQAAIQCKYMGSGSVRGIEMLTLTTGEGKDSIITRGERYNDIVTTNGGIDKVAIAGGRDVVDLGAGRDTLVIDWSDIDYGQTHAFSGTLAAGYGGAFYWGPSPADGAHDRVDFAGVERFDIKLGSGGDDIRTGDDNDRVISGAGNDWIRSGAGADSVHGGNNLDGTRGVDVWVADKTAAAAIVLDLNSNAVQTYQLGALTAQVSGIEALGLDTGSEKFSASNGADRIVTVDARYNDFIAANNGNDVITFAGGRDWADLGAGTDTLVIDWSDLDYGQTTSIGGSLAAGYAGVFYWAPSPGDGAHDRVDFIGVEKFDITMGSGHDRIVTGDGADTLAGGLGNDTLIGGGGGDRFVFDTALDAASNSDTIDDFATIDTIVLDLSVFAAAGLEGALKASAFHVGAAAATARHRIIYDDATGKLFYDADGSGAGAAVQFATLDIGLAPTSADFLIVA